MKKYVIIATAVVYKCQNGLKKYCNIIQEKIIKSTIYNLSSFRMFAKKKKNLVETIISKNRTQRKSLGMRLQVGQYLQDVHLMKKKINVIITEERTVLKNCVKC